MTSALGCSCRMRNYMVSVPNVHKGEGVQKFKKYAEIIYGWSLGDESDEGDRLAVGLVAGQLLGEEEGALVGEL